MAGGLLAVARDGDPHLRAAAVDAIGAPEARWWVAVDEALRERWWSAPLLSRAIAADLADGTVTLLGVVLAGCHHNGRIREAAIARLADHGHPAAIAVLALRAADWVAEVRTHARAVLEAHIPATTGPALAVLAELAFALRRRRQGEWLAQRVEALLRELPAQALSPLLSARDRRTRRAAYRAAIAATWIDRDRLTRAALRDDDLLIRTMCARAAIALAGHPREVRGFLASRTALVRAEALRTLTAAGEVDVAVAALPDRHPLVRAIAQDALRAAGLDPAVHYRRLIAEDQPPAGAIAGLGETGERNDSDAVARHLSHPQPRGRVAAVRALRRLAAPDLTDLLIPLLRDASPAVTRQVLATLRPTASTLDPAMLHAMLAPANAAHIRFTGYHLLTDGDAWLRLATNLRLVEDADERLRATSRADIVNWLDRHAATTYHRPTSRRAAELDNLIERARPILGPQQVRLLRFHAGLPHPAGN